MPTQSNPYKITDKAIELLNKRAVRRFSKAKDEAAEKRFDELSVIGIAKTLYADLEADNEEVFEDLAEMAYEQAEPHGEEKPNRDWLLALLLAYSAVTKYVYLHEVDRKRDRTAEAINSTTAKATEFKRGLMYWSQMTAQYADNVTDEATVKAFRDAGVERVRWITERDSKVCEKCRERDGKIYPINAIPPKTHWRCRCHLEAVREK